MFRAGSGSCECVQLPLTAEFDRLDSKERRYCSLVSTSEVKVTGFLFLRRVLARTGWGGGYSISGKRDSSEKSLALLVFLVAFLVSGAFLAAALVFLGFTATFCSSTSSNTSSYCLKWSSIAWTSGSCCCPKSSLSIITNACWLVYIPSSTIIASIYCFCLDLISMSACVSYSHVLRTWI